VKGEEVALSLGKSEIIRALDLPISIEIASEDIFLEPLV